MFALETTVLENNVYEMVLDFESENSQQFKYV